jgi:hypothetical protein
MNATLFEVRNGLIFCNGTSIIICPRDNEGACISDGFYYRNEQGQDVGPFECEADSRIELYSYFARL